jgi:hypothetical protein
MIEFAGPGVGEDQIKFAVCGSLKKCGRILADGRSRGDRDRGPIVTPMPLILEVAFRYSNFSSWQ